MHERRTGTEHQELGLLCYMERNRRRAELFDMTGTRFSEFIRLPYFDAPRMTVIDPMHRCFLGTSPRSQTISARCSESGVSAAPSEPTNYFIFRDRQDSMAARMDQREYLTGTGGAAILVRPVDMRGVVLRG